MGNFNFKFEPWMVEEIKIGKNGMMQCAMFYLNGMLTQ